MGIKKESCLHVQVSFSFNSVLAFFLVIALELPCAHMVALGLGEGFLIRFFGAPGALQEPTLTWAFSSRGSSNKNQGNICLSVLLLITE